MTPTTLDAEETLPREPGLAMVLFRADGSDAGDRVAEILAQLARASASPLPVTEIDVEARPTLAARYHVQQTPTILLVKDGEVVDQVIGAATRTLLQSLLDARAPRSGGGASCERGPSRGAGPRAASR